MRALKTLFLFCFATIASIRSEHYFGYGQHDHKLIQTKAGNNNEESNVYHNCVCFNKRQPPVSEVLAKDGGNVKRLVVYLYKDPDSNTLQMYTPNKHNQDQFPDLGIDDGELIKVGQETVAEVFEKNNSVDVNKLQNQDSENLANKGNGVEVYPGLTEKLDVTNADEYLNPDQNEAVATESPTVIKNLDINEMDPFKKYVNPNSDTNAAVVETLGQDEYSADLNKNYGIASDFPNVEGFPAEEMPLMQLNSSSSLSSNSDDSSVTDSLHQNSKPLINISTTMKNNNFAVPYEQTSQDENSKNLWNLKSDSDFTSGSESQLPTIPVKDYGVQVISEKEFNEKNKGHKKSLQVDNKQDKTGSEYVTFDIWFEKQMQNIQNTGKDKNKNFDLSSMKNLIEKTLFDNGIYVTKDGVLTDSEANLLDVDILKLRPLLIGDSVTYNNVFSENNYQLPSNLAYLESVMVTLVNPPKILGVVPVRKTFLPRISYRAGLDFGAWKAKNACRSLQCVLQQKSNQERKKQTSKLQNSNRPSVKPIPGKSQHFKNSYNNKHKQSVDDPVNKIQYRFNWKNVLSAVHRILSPPEERQKVNGPKKVNLKPNYDNEIFEEDSTVDYGDDELELPGFRIIGGNPATSSGTPISVKGRSGFLLND